MIDKQTLVERADRLQIQKLDPIPKYLLVRDILTLPARDLQLLRAKEQIALSKWVQQLYASQWPDGSWGRLHTSDTAVRQVIPTTEAGVERALALGLDAGDTLLVKTADFLEAVLAGYITIRDHAERNDRWPHGIELFTASTLARINPRANVLDEAWEKWFAIAQNSVASGCYEEQAELDAARRVLRVSVKDSYLRLSSRYALSLLSSRADHIPGYVETALLKWIWTREQGVGYLGRPLSRPPTVNSPKSVELWLRSHEILARFPGWFQVARDIFDWLWSVQNEEGYWDFGRRWDRGWIFPFSENWRKHSSRFSDWSIRMLILLGEAAER